MLEVRRSAERGTFDHGWLKTSHTFSFADYYDPRWVEYGALRVINDDRVAPGRGFGKHGHRDMEIITYILEGELEHRDSLGNGSVIRVGEVQRLSAGRASPTASSTPRALRRCTFCRSGSCPRRCACRRGTSRRASAPPTSADACGSSPRTTAPTARSSSARTRASMPGCSPAPSRPTSCLRRAGAARAARGHGRGSAAVRSALVAQAGGRNPGR